MGAWFSSSGAGDLAKAEGYYRRQVLSAKSGSAFGSEQGWRGLSMVARNRGDLDQKDLLGAGIPSLAQTLTFLVRHSGYSVPSDEVATMDHDSEAVFRSLVEKAEREWHALDHDPAMSELVYVRSDESFSAHHYQSESTIPTTHPDGLSVLSPV